MSSQLRWIMSLEIYNPTESHMRNQKPRLFDAVDLMVSSASGFQSLPTNIGTETFPWTLPHKCRLAHATLTSSLCFFLLLPPLPLSPFPHTQACSQTVISALTGGKEEKIPCWAYQAIWMWLCKWALLDPCNSVDIWSPRWLLISYTHLQTFMSVVDVYDCWTIW